MPILSPLARYHADLKQKDGFFYDPVQESAVHHTQRLFLQLSQARHDGGLLRRFLQRVIAQKKSQK